MTRLYLILLFLWSLAACAPRDGLDLKVREFKLDNGLRVLLVKREGAPLFSSSIRIRVGSIEDPPGGSGLAHFFEHMAFKGTSLIGSRDPQKESAALAAMHEVGSEIVKQRLSGVPEEELAPLKKKLTQMQDEADAFVDRNEFTRIYQRNGGTDSNAATASDDTVYYVSLPANKLRLWSYMESERLRDPVFREFYKERDVVAEERRMRYENNPDGKLFQALMALGFDRGPYGIPVIGTNEDIANYTLEEAKAFREANYVPSNIVIALVGNFDLNEAQSVIQKDFGRLPAREPVKKTLLSDSKQGLPRSQTIHENGEPRFYMGFHRPPHPHPDDEVLDVIQELLCEGRTSRLFHYLVDEKKMVSRVSCYTTLPGDRLEGLFSFYAVPLAPHTNQEVREEIFKVFGNLTAQPVSAEELDKIRNGIDADLLAELQTNSGLAGLLSYFESSVGDWRYLYDLRKRIRKVTPEDVSRVIKKYFDPQKSVTVYLEKKPS